MVERDEMTGERRERIETECRGKRRRMGIKRGRKRRGDRKGERADIGIEFKKHNRNIYSITTWPLYCATYTCVSGGRLDG